MSESLVESFRLVGVFERRKTTKIFRICCCTRAWVESLPKTVSHFIMENTKLTLDLHEEISDHLMDFGMFSDFIGDSEEIKEPYFYLEYQPYPFQRKTYPNGKRKELRRFKPSVLKIIPNSFIETSIQYGTAVMRIIDDDNEVVNEALFQVCEMNSDKKIFSFHPTATETSHGKNYRLQFNINFVLDSGELKSQVLLSNCFRIVSRITRRHTKMLSNSL